MASVNEKFLNRQRKKKPDFVAPSQSTKQRLVYIKYYSTLLSENNILPSQFQIDI